jgi:hypothetical protein
VVVWASYSYPIRCGDWTFGHGKVYDLLAPIARVCRTTQLLDSARLHNRKAARRRPPNSESLSYAVRRRARRELAKGYLITVIPAAATQAVRGLDFA